MSGDSISTNGCALRGVVALASSLAGTELTTAGSSNKRTVDVSFVRPWWQLAQLTALSR